MCLLSLFSLSLPFIFYKTKGSTLSHAHDYPIIHTLTLSHLHSQAHHHPHFKEEEEGAIAKASRKRTVVIQREVIQAR